MERTHTFTPDGQVVDLKKYGVAGRSGRRPGFGGGVSSYGKNDIVSSRGVDASDREAHLQAADEHDRAAQSLRQAAKDTDSKAGDVRLKEAATFHEEAADLHRTAANLPAGQKTDSGIPYSTQAQTSSRKANSRSYDAMNFAREKEGLGRIEFE